MDVDSLPDAPDKSSRRTSGLVVNNAAWDQKVAALILKGWTPGELAGKLGKTTREKRAIRMRVRRLIARLPELQLAMIEAEKGAAFENLDGRVAEAIGRRARRGRIDAAKLLYEVSGVHNPRVRHEHSGDIKITLDLPRPPRQQDTIGASSEDPIVDATVIDD